MTDEIATTDDTPDFPNAGNYSDHTDEDGVLPADKVGFNPDAIAGAWEATEGVVPMVGAPIANAFATDEDGTYFALDTHDGVHSDRDAWFVDVEGVDGNTYEVLVEEKAVGVVDRDTDVPDSCHKVELQHDDRRALYVAPAQIFVTRRD